jgi:predicted N-acetyltransferase YhbS
MYHSKGVFDLIIRPSNESDLADVLRIETKAFEEEGPEIADLVHGLLHDPSARPILSLLAIQDDQPIGHILFTKARLGPSDPSISAVILAPLAVIPEMQRKGVGGCLIRKGLRLLTDRDIDLVFVLGHPTYYPRHGFQPAGVLGFEAPYPILEKDKDAWMVQQLRRDVIGNVKGKVRCADVLNHPEHWRE